MLLPAMPQGGLQSLKDPKLRGISSPLHCFGPRCTVGNYCLVLASMPSLLLSLISIQPRRTSRSSRFIPTAVQRSKTVNAKPRQGSTGKRSGQVEIDEVPFFDRFHNSITGFPFPLGPFLQRRTIRKEVGTVPVS